MSATLTADLKTTTACVTPWPHFPSVYEINTWVWLSELSRKLRKHVDLASVPGSEWDGIAELGFDAVWFMGVWERSPAGTAIANSNPGLMDSFRQALPDFQPEDNVGSPYCVRRYVVDGNLGGPEGLAVARRELASRGIRLILDFVPNHVAPDHPWAGEHPEYFIRGTDEDLRKDPSSYVAVAGEVYACGRDPYFPAWPDVLQLNAFSPELRKAVLETVADIAEQCDGIRCDMAMLLMSSVFERTWEFRAGARPTTEYWVELISQIKKRYPNFIFIAEAYWDLEWDLQQQGFDFCYDKKLYDRLEHAKAESVRLHLCAELAYQYRLVRFIENHDEPRAAQTFPGLKQRAVALSIATLPGMKLFHEGQLEARQVRLPVFLGRRPAETIDNELQSFYSSLLFAVNQPVFRGGQWSLCERIGWPDNASFENIVAWSWWDRENRYLIVVNLSDVRSQALIRVPWQDVSERTWLLRDVLSGSTYERDGNEMWSPGLYVELGPWGFHFFQGLRTIDS